MTYLIFKRASLTSVVQFRIEFENDSSSFFIILFLFLM